MKKILITALLLATSAVFAHDPTATNEPFKLIHVADLAKWMDAKDKKTYVFDANNEKVRTSEGVIPGATILASTADYDVAKTLPTDKSSTLVFYCASEACSASHIGSHSCRNCGL